MLHKKFLFPLTIFIISFFQIACVNTRTTNTESINIVDIRSKETQVNLPSHKPNDVEVFRINFMGEGYKVRYYQKENGALVHHEAWYIINERFDKASYKWLSDTSVAIRLFNSKTNNEKKFEVFGNGGWSGMRD